MLFQRMVSSVNGAYSQTFLTSGTFVVPAGVTEIRVVAIGMGGFGGPGTPTTSGGGGGGGGGYIRGTKEVTPGDTVTITIGDLGTGVVHTGQSLLAGNGADGTETGGGTSGTTFASAPWVSEYVAGGGASGPTGTTGGNGGSINSDVAPYVLFAGVGGMGGNMVDLATAGTNYGGGGGGGGGNFATQSGQTGGPAAVIIYWGY